MLRRRAGDLRALLLAALCAASLLVGGSPASAQRLTMRHVAVDALVFPLTPTQWALEAAVEDAGPEWERVDWMKITIDGNEHLATVNGWIGSIPWNAAGVGNPSEHVASARAKISGTIMGEPISMELSSLNPPGGTPPGDGEPIRFILADLRVESLRFNTPISLRWNKATPVGKPEYLWDAAGQPPQIPYGSVPCVQTNPAAYVRNNPVEVEVTLFNNITGGCQIGCTLRLEATPNTGADPLLLINNPVYPPTPKTVSGRVATFTGTTSLYNTVAHYVVDVRDLQVWVKFSTGQWGVVSTADHAWGSLFATLSTPVLAMQQPWAAVLAYGCTWAAGATEAVEATSALADGAYGAGTYVGAIAHADDNLIYLQDWLEGGYGIDGSGNPFYFDPLTGQCDDFADWLACLSTALGAVPLTVRRGGPITGTSFTTTDITPAGLSSSTYNWEYHRWSHQLSDDSVYDSSLRFTGGSVPKHMGTSSYVSSLSDNCQPGAVDPVSVEDQRPIP